LKYPNILWAISQIGNRYKFAAMIGRSESWLSRRLLGRVPFTPDERQIVAQALGYPAEWLFQHPFPPIVVQSPGVSSEPVAQAAEEFSSSGKRTKTQTPSA